ncbi:MAG: WD40 repeat domain-containing protein [Candidatus Aminicenantes bacterium]|nr:WD40 repeat domain-containing protein [Candidatus Aminicenantes bacterium]
MKKIILTIATLSLCIATALLAVQTQKWELRNLDDFLDGKFDGISVSFDGVLALSPNEEMMEGPEEEFLLSFIPGPSGDFFLGSGHAGKIYRINSAGKHELYYQVPEVDIYCLALDSKGNLYAGSSPNGKVYKITEKGKGEPFFNPQEKYIWDLKFTSKGSLLAAVGESGGIYEISEQGEGAKFLSAEENHILCMEISANGSLIAGSGGKGRLYRISPEKRTSILFESPFEEIKTIALDRNGNIYAAAGGIVPRPAKEEKSSVAVKSDTEVSMTVTPQGSMTQTLSPHGDNQPGVLYRVNSDGIAKKLWSSADELVYSLLWNEAKNELLFGTGMKGRVYSIDKDDKVSLIIQKNAEQIYLLKAYGSRIYTLANNPPSLSAISSEQRYEGQYTSSVLDAKTLASWGRIEWNAEMPSGAILQFQTRSGNSGEPNQTWSDWSPPYQKSAGEQILNPKARYIQFRVNFKTQSAKVSPQLQQVSLFYLQTNLAPVLTKLELLPPNEVYLKPPEQNEVILGAEVDLNDEAQNADTPMGFMVSKKVERKGYQTVVWDAVDENGDVLTYTISIRIENENKWRLLKSDWPEKIFAFDTLTLPDGVYFIRVQAQDKPANPVGMGLNSEKISRPLVIDNSLPVIRNFQATRNKNSLTLSFSAEDSFSHLSEVKYIVRPEGWQSLFPADGICDSKKEDFNITLTLPPDFDDMITVKVVDTKGNVGVYRSSI